MTVLHTDESVTVCVKSAGAGSETDMPELLRAAGAGPALCVHRLDTAVGGVMVYAKTPRAASALSREIAAGGMEKTYIAVCAGVPEPSEGEMCDLLFKDSRANKSYVVRRERKGVRRARLEYVLLGTLGEGERTRSLVRVRLHMGRSHQIRVQFASRKMPLLGDGKYGSRIGGEIALWSYSLSFTHPGTGGRVSFTAPPPEREPWSAFAKGESNAEF
ncbi:MAG: RluA family pseudouridine synthase [Butyricicoccus sp.]|nr:RluA family pseudouridine synthase [Butyricicoccus sp.]